MCLQHNIETSVRLQYNIERSCFLVTQIIGVCLHLEYRLIVRLDAQMLRSVFTLFVIGDSIRASFYADGDYPRAAWCRGYD